MKRIFPSLFLIFFLVSLVSAQEADTIRNILQAQQDSLNLRSDSLISRTDSLILRSDSLRRVGSDIVRMDSLPTFEPDYTHSASRAIMYALVLPGLGQGYNRKYYKIPIVYAGIGGAGYAIVFNTRQYREAGLVYALDTNDTNERILQFWRRNMELSYIGLIVVYALQVVDAYVDAQLHNWDVDQNLSLRVSPSVQPLITPGSNVPSYGLSCRIDLKRR